MGQGHTNLKASALQEPSLAPRPMVWTLCSRAALDTVLKIHIHRGRSNKISMESVHLNCTAFENNVLL